MQKVPVGFSTKLGFLLILGAITAFIVAWVESGTAPAWLAGIAAGLTAVLSIARSWQAVNAPLPADEHFVVDENPVDPDDLPPMAADFTD